MFKKGLLTLLPALLILMEQAHAATYYSKTSGGNWNDASSWSTTGYGQSTNTGTFPKSGDYAYIGDGYTIIINVNCTTSYLFVGQGSSGILEYSAAGSYNLVVVNNATVNAGATIRYTGNSTRTHTFQVGNNLVNNGDMDLYADADDVVNMVFYRPSNSVISGSGTCDLNRVTVQKSTSTSFYAEVQSTTFESGIRELIITYGTYHHNNSSSYEVNAAGTAFSIPSDGVLKISQGVMHLSPAQDEAYLSGTINVSGGTLKIGDETGLKGLRYDKTSSFVPRLDIQSGNLEVYGGITYKSGSSSSSLNFSISGGTVLLNSGTTGTAETVFNVNDVSGSVCSFYDGSLVIQAPNTSGTSVTDLTLCPANGSMVCSGGFIQFGNSSSGSGLTYTFSPHASLNLPNVILTGPSGSAATLCPAENSTADISMISLYIASGKTFDIRSASASGGDTRSFKLTGNYDGINSLYCDGTFLSRNSSLLLEGGEGQQIAGDGTFDLYNFEINNGTGMTLGQDISVSGTLSLLAGIIYTTSENALTIQSSATITNASENAYVDGPLIRNFSSASPAVLDFPIGKDGYYRPLWMNISHSNSSQAVYTVELMNANPGNLNYTLPGSIDRISGVRYYTTSRTGAANLVSIAYTLYYGSDDGVTDPSMLRLMTDDGASNWSDKGGTGTGPTSGSITSSALAATNNVITLGNANGGSNPLPVTWLYFKLSKMDPYVQVDWATATEKNTDYFEVQRSMDGFSFHEIARYMASGQSNTPRYYSCLNKPSAQATVYYRIKQVDLDGQYSFSAIEAVRCNTDQVVIYPNPPLDDSINILLAPDFSGRLNITTTDESGQLISNDQYEVTGNTLKVPVSREKAGRNLVLSIQDDSGKKWTGRVSGYRSE